MKTNTKSAAERLPSLKPDIIGMIVPSDAATEKAAFLKGEVRNPNHDYTKLDEDLTDNTVEIIRTGESAIEELGEDSKHIDIYQDTVKNFTEILDYATLLGEYNRTTDASKKAEYRAEIMKLNVEMYGEPTRKDYDHVLASYKAKIEKKPLMGKSGELFSDLKQLLPHAESLVDTGGYAPNPETMQWMQGVVEGLYGNLLAHVEDDREYNPTELAALFQGIIDQEFGASAEGWIAAVEPAKSITVKAQEKKIVIPEDRGMVGSEKAKDLVVHEIGTHMLRAVTGYETDVTPLATGLSGYIDSEEGLAVAMEQARKGKYVEAGHGLYLVASLAHFEDMDFRQVFETMWRIQALTAYKGDDVTEDAIEKARNTAYNLCMRVFRGTDDLPWFKDLQYYNGAQEVWKHLDKICGDEFALQLMLMGKTDVTNPNQVRTLLESKTI